MKTIRIGVSVGVLLYALILTVVAWRGCRNDARRPGGLVEQAGKWLGLAFVAMGYMGQSLFVKMMRFLQKKVDPKDDNS